MTNTIIALAGYIIWTMLLLLALAAYRTSLAKERKSIKFMADGSDVPDVGQRLTRAQANCSESFAIMGGTMLLALATNSAVITDGLALILLGARVGQSIVHLASTTTLAIQIRFVLFLIQLGICGYWLLMIVQKFAG